MSLKPALLITGGLGALIVAWHFGVVCGEEMERERFLSAWRFGPLPSSPEVGWSSVGTATAPKPGPFGWQVTS